MRLGGTNFRGQLLFFPENFLWALRLIIQCAQVRERSHMASSLWEGVGETVLGWWRKYDERGGWFLVGWRHHGRHLLMEIIGKKSGLFRIQRIMWRHHGGRSWTMMTVDRSLTILMWKHPNYIPSITCGWTRWKLRTECILAASKAPSQELVPDLCLSVCPFVCLSVTAFLLW